MVTLFYHSCTGVAVGFVGQAVVDGAAVALLVVVNDAVAAEGLAHVPVKFVNFRQCCDFHTTGKTTTG